MGIIWWLIDDGWVPEGIRRAWYTSPPVNEKWPSYALREQQNGSEYWGPWFGLFGKLRMLSALTTLFVLQEVSMLLNSTLALWVHCTWSRCPMISPSPKQATGGPTGPGQTAWFCSNFGLRSLLLREVHGMCWRIRRNVPLTMQVRIPVAKSLKRLRRSQKPSGSFNQAWGTLFWRKTTKDVVCSWERLLDILSSHSAAL